MRVLIDTNILFSALLFPRSKPAKALIYVEIIMKWYYVTEISLS